MALYYDHLGTSGSHFIVSVFQLVYPQDVKLTEKEVIAAFASLDVKAPTVVAALCFCVYCGYHKHVFSMVAIRTTEQQHLITFLCQHYSPRKPAYAICPSQILTRVSFTVRLDRW